MLGPSTRSARGEASERGRRERGGRWKWTRRLVWAVGSEGEGEGAVLQRDRGLACGGEKDEERSASGRKVSARAKPCLKS